MRYREPYPLQKVTLWVRQGDWDWLQNQHQLGASRIVRELIVEYRRKIEDLEAPREELSALDLEGLFD